MSTPSLYSAGVCNLDDASARSRHTLSICAAIIGVSSLFLLFSLHVNPIFRYIHATVFSGLTLIYWFQAKEKFCVVNGMTGRYEVDRKKSKIEGQITNALDRSKSIKMFLKTVGLAAIIGLIGLV